MFKPAALTLYERIPKSDHGYTVTYGRNFRRFGHVTADRCLEMRHSRMSSLKKNPLILPSFDLDYRRSHFRPPPCFTGQSHRA